MGNVLWVRIHAQARAWACELGPCTVGGCDVVHMLGVLCELFCVHAYMPVKVRLRVHVLLCVHACVHACMRSHVCSSPACMVFMPTFASGSPLNNRMPGLPVICAGMDPAQRHVQQLQRRVMTHMLENVLAVQAAQGHGRSHAQADLRTSTHACTHMHPFAPAHAHARIHSFTQRWVQTPPMPLSGQATLQGTEHAGTR